MNILALRTLWFFPWFRSWLWVKQHCDGETFLPPFTPSHHNVLYLDSKLTRVGWEPHSGISRTPMVESYTSLPLFRPPRTTFSFCSFHLSTPSISLFFLPRISVYPLWIPKNNSFLEVSWPRSQYGLSANSRTAFKHRWTHFSKHCPQRGTFMTNWNK